MKRIISIALLISISLCLGFGVGWSISHMAGDGTHRPDAASLGVALVVSGISLIIGILVNTVLHEGGHLLAGLASGYKFLSFRIFSKTLVKGEDGYTWKKFNIPGTMGQCLMVPPEDKAGEDAPYFWYNAGGVLMNLIVALASGSLIYFLDLPRIPFCVCMMFAGIAAWMLLFNAIPMTPGGVPNDGMNILTLWRHPEQRSIFTAMMLANAELTRGKRPAEMPAEWFRSQPVKRGCSVMDIAARSLAMARLVDELRLDEAHEMGMELLALDTALPQLYKMEVSSDLIYLHLATRGDDGMLPSLWDKNTQRYVKGCLPFMPMKRVAMFAIELVHNNDRGAAMKHYDAVKDGIDNYSTPGEARTALAVMDHMLSSHPVNQGNLTEQNING